MVKHQSLTEIAKLSDEETVAIWLEQRGLMTVKVPTDTFDPTWSINKGLTTDPKPFKTQEAPTVKRWAVLIYYRTKDGESLILHELEELSDLHEIVEAGPHFDTIARINVFRINHIDSPNLAVEATEQL